MPLGANKAAIMGVSGVETIGTTIALLSTQTASNSATISFTSDITSKYREYVFAIYNLNPATDGTHLGFQGDANGGDNDYNDLLITSTSFNAYHAESDGAAALAYETGHDQAQVAGFQNISNTSGNGADENNAIKLHLFNPASTTYVKHFYARTSGLYEGDYNQDFFIGGYFNTTSAINAIQFKMSSGNFDGKIKMWGVP
jgi:hypothetical protein